MSKHKCFWQEKPLYTLVTLEQLKSVQGVDDREDKLAGYCLVTSTYTLIVDRFIAIFGGYGVSLVLRKWVTGTIA